MNEILKRLVESSGDLKTFGRELRESGIETVRGAASNLGIVRSLYSVTGESERDETHYFLFPDYTGEQSGLVYTTRVLPEGALANNELPKVRVFHLASVTDLQRLEAILTEETKRELSENEPFPEADLAEMLERLAAKVDEEADYLTGGIMLVGGAVTFFNPVAGIGISIAGWAASVGTKASVAGTEYLGAKIRKWSGERAEQGLEKRASEAVRSLKPEIFVNPVLCSLERLSSDDSSNYDPFLDHTNWIDGFSPRHFFALTAEAVAGVYELKESLAPLNQVHQSWVDSLKPAE